MSKSTLYNWERGRSTPAICHLPAVTRFLGYDPTEHGTTLGERLYAKRRSQGLSRRALAADLGIDESSITAVERGKSPGSRLRAIVTAYLDG